MSELLLWTTVTAAAGLLLYLQLKSLKNWSDPGLIAGAATFFVLVIVIVIGCL